MRAFAWFAGLLILAILGAILLAYPAFELVAGVGWRFDRVASRLAMLLLALELIWYCRHLGLRTKADFGYGLPWRRFVAQALLWGVIGALSAAAGAVFLLAADLRALAPGFVPTLGACAHLLLIGMGSGVTVALLEESVMRGALHTAIARESGQWTAAVLTATLFAALHFFAKARIPADELSWSSGYDLLLRSFVPLSHPLAILDSFFAWTTVFLILSWTRILTGNIAVAIGLHAGWVVVLRMLQEATISTAAAKHSIWVGSFDGLLGYWMLPWAFALAVALWLTQSRWVPQVNSQIRRCSGNEKPTGQLEDRANQQASGRGCSIEVAVPGLDQRTVRIRAIRATVNSTNFIGLIDLASTEGIQDCLCGTRRHLEHRAKSIGATSGGRSIKITVAAPRYPTRRRKAIGAATNAD